MMELPEAQNLPDSVLSYSGPRASGALVALVGRPNVGKSTLFNRLTGAQVSIVEDIPGTTRDRIYGDVLWNGRTFGLIDTGGLDLEGETAFAQSVRKQVEAAMAEADVIVFMVDGQSGVTAADQEIADLLRTTSKPVLLAVNKTESHHRRLESSQFYEVGLGDPIPIASHHGQGTGDLLDAIVLNLPDDDYTTEETSTRIAIVGRPNVGKSSLLNALLGFERVMVSPIAGTTRDATDTVLIHNDQKLTLIDTAGIRRRGHIDGSIERYSVMRSFRAIARADVAALVIDATLPTTNQDAHIAGYVQEATKGVMIVVNKWDLVEKDAYTADEFISNIRRDLHFIPYAPILFVSAVTKQRVTRIIEHALTINEERHRRVPTAALNDAVRDAMREHSPPSANRRLLKIRYVTQAEISPPTFVFFVNDAELVHFSYRRFLENRLRERFGFAGTAIRLIFRTQNVEDAATRIAARTAAAPVLSTETDGEIVATPPPPPPPPPAPAPRAHRPPARRVHARPANKGRRPR